MAAEETMYQDRSAENSKYFDRLQAYSTSQAAVNQQSYGVQQPGGMPADMSYKQRIRAISDNKYNSASGTDMTNYRRVMAREQEIYREKLNASISRYSAEAIPGAFMGMVSGMVAPYFVMQPMAKFHERQQEYRYAGYQFANSIDTYADKTGTRNFSYAQSNQLGTVLRDRSFQGGGSNFFGMGDLQRMNQIGAANGMLNVGNVAGGNSIENQTKEYARQFDQLRKNTEMVVKTLKTTMEGGLKVIKDMKAMGVRDTDIQGFVGKMAGGAQAAGMSYQGFQTLGGVGAQLAQQSGMNAMVGISGIQTAAMQLSQQNFYDPSMRRIINSVGGVANAAAMVSQANMSLLNTPVGTKMMAAMMNRDAATGVASFDEKAQDRLLSGKMSGYEITQRANGYGYKVGAAGRFMAKYDFQEAYQNLNAQQRDKMMRSYVSAWGNSYQRQGTKREWAYGAMESLGITDVNQVRLLAENYLRPPDETLYKAADQYGALMQQSTGSPGLEKRGLFNGALNRNMYDAAKNWSQTAFGIGAVAGSPVTAAIGVGRWAARSFQRTKQWLDTPRGNFFSNFTEGFFGETSTLGPDRSSMESRENTVALFTGLARPTYGDMHNVYKAMDDKKSVFGKMAKDVLSGKSTAKADAIWAMKSDPNAFYGLDKMSTAKANDIAETMSRLLANRSTAVENFRLALGTNLRNSVSSNWANKSEAETMRFIEGHAQNINYRNAVLNEQERKTYGITTDSKGRTSEAFLNYKSMDFRQINLNRLVVDEAKRNNGTATVEDLQKFAEQKAVMLGVADKDAAKAAVYSAAGGLQGIAARRGVLSDGKNYQAMYAERDAATKALEDALGQATVDKYNLGQKKKGKSRQAHADASNTFEGKMGIVEDVAVSASKNPAIMKLIKQGSIGEASSLIATTYSSGGDIADRIAKAMERVLKANGAISDAKGLQAFERTLERRLGSSGEKDTIDALKKFMTKESLNSKERDAANIGLKNLGIDDKIKEGMSAADVAALMNKVSTNTDAGKTINAGLGTKEGMVSSLGDAALFEVKSALAKKMGYSLSQKGVDGEGKETQEYGLFKEETNAVTGFKTSVKIDAAEQVQELNKKLNEQVQKAVLGYDTFDEKGNKIESGVLPERMEKIRLMMAQSAQLDALSKIQNGQGQTSTSTGQASPTVSSPILNYWNNNWSFSGR